MRERTRIRIVAWILCLILLISASGCQQNPIPEEETEPLELMDFVGQPLSTIKPYLGDIVSIEADAIDGSPVVIFDHVQVRYYSKEETIVGFYLPRDLLSDLEAFSVMGVTLDMDNSAVLEALGKPVNGDRQSLIYTEDYSLWWKFNFDSEDQMENIQVFYAKDQGDRTFVDWRKS